jgi:hypothetical protein
MRVELFLAPYRPLSEAEVKQMKTNVNFLLDCQYSGDAAIRRAALLQLGKVTGKSIEIPTNPPGDELIPAISSLRDSLTAPATQP